MSWLCRAQLQAARAPARAKAASNACAACQCELRSSVVFIKILSETAWMAALFRCLSVEDSLQTVGRRRPCGFGGRLARAEGAGRSDSRVRGQFRRMGPDLLDPVLKFAGAGDDQLEGHAYAAATAAGVAIAVQYSLARMENRQAADLIRHHFHRPWHR